MTPALPKTLSRYLAKLFAVNLIFMGAILLGVIYLFDMIELLRRASKFEDVPFGVLFEMGLLKVPDMSEVILPFAVLFSAIFTFWQLSKRQELVVLRSAGVSVWQFLSPIILIALIAGVLMVGVLNPLGATLYSRYTVMENKYLDRGQNNMVAVFDEGMWLRQETREGYAFLHAGTIQLPEWRLEKVMVLFFRKDNQFDHRLDAQNASLKPGNWLFRETVLSLPGKPSQREASTTLPTSLTPKEIEESFSTPQSMGFWQIPSFVATLESAGFDSTRLRIHFQTLLAQPLLYIAMILLAASVALRPQRQGGTFLFVIGGILIGFFIFFFSSFLQALGASHQLPVFLAAWSPSMLSSLLGVAALLTLEDG